MKYIELRGKKHRTVDDVPYNIVKKFKELQRQNNDETLEGDLDELLIELLTTTICPSLKIDFKNMSYEDKDLGFGEVKKLVVDLRDRFEEIVTTQLDIAMHGTSDKKAKEIGTQEVKNGEEVTTK